MEITYRHDIFNNYMIISEKYLENNYKLNMLSNNNISGLLELSYMQINDSIELRYDITSKQCFMDLFEKKNIGINELLYIINSLISTVNNLKKYMLDSNNLILELKYVYISIKEEKAYFCCNPYYEGNFFVSFKQAMSEILHLINYDDKDAVQLTYRIYDLCNKEIFCIDDVNRLLSENILLKQKDKKEYCEEGKYIKEESKRNEKYEKLNQYKQKDISDEYICEGEDEECEYEDKSIIQKLAEIIKDKICSLSKGKYVNYNAKEESKTDETNIIANNEVIDEENNIYSEYDEKLDSETVLISEILSNSTRKMISISGQPDIVVSNYPFIIGKLNDNVDAQINDILISRIHAKIINDDGKLFVEDLNSKNGTYINDILLSPHEMCQVEIGDRITFATSSYILK